MIPIGEFGLRVDSERMQAMRDADLSQESLFTVRKLDDFVPAGHPLRPIRERANQTLLRLDGLFSRIASCR